MESMEKRLKNERISISGLSIRQYFAFHKAIIFICMLNKTRVTAEQSQRASLSRGSGKHVGKTRALFPLFSYHAQHSLHTRTAVAVRTLHDLILHKIKWLLHQHFRVLSLSRCFGRFSLNNRHSFIPMHNAFSSIVYTLYTHLCVLSIWMYRMSIKLYSCYFIRIFHSSRNPLCFQAFTSATYY